MVVPSSLCLDGRCRMACAHRTEVESRPSLSSRSGRSTIPSSESCGDREALRARKGRQGVRGRASTGAAWPTAHAPAPESARCRAAELPFGCIDRSKPEDPARGDVSSAPERGGFSCFFCARRVLVGFTFVSCPARNRRCDGVGRVPPKGAREIFPRQENGFGDTRDAAPVARGVGGCAERRGARAPRNGRRHISGGYTARHTVRRCGRAPPLPLLFFREIYTTG